MKVSIHFGGQVIHSDAEKISIGFDGQYDVIATEKLKEILNQNLKTNENEKVG